MKNICVGTTLLFFVLFSSSCVISQQGKIQTSKNQEVGKAEYELGKKFYYGKGVPKDFVKAAEWYRKAAEWGNANAQYNLGLMFYYGQGVPQDYAEALKWYRKAAEQGLAEAQFFIGKMYRYGEGIPKDYTVAVEWYREAAKQGNFDAQFFLGLMFYYGTGVPQDYTKAAEWYRKAAEQGDAEAQFFLGDMYKIGEGVPQDYTKAAEWYRKAAEQGNVAAQYSLGTIYYIGKAKGVPQDYTKAAEWYRKAAEKGYTEAQFFLGAMYKIGEGVPKDFVKAAEWLRKSAERGNALAQYSLGSMYYEGKGVPQDYEEAVKWCREAAEQGHAKAQCRLSTEYALGINVPQDYTEAAKWCRKAAEQGDDIGQYLLGLAYEDGKGVPKDYTKATEWYRKAAEQGYADARFRLGKLLEETDYPGWECLNMRDTEYFFINKNKIRQQGNLVWYWTMNVPFQESHSDKKCTKHCLVADCDSARLGHVSYIEYDSNSEVLHSHTFKESEIDMSPVVPGSIGESTLEYACSHAKAGTYKKEETAKAGACFGTGWSVASGFVVTNNHVVEGRNHITLIRPDGVKIPASVAAHDAFNDLALLKVEDVGLLPAALPLSSKPAVLGEKVVTIGYPHPDLLGVKPKLTEGVVNSTFGLGDDPRALQISVPIQAGNSGGPLLNMEGKVVGIVTSKVDAVKMFKWTGDLPQNINYGIKISYLKGLLSSVSQKQRIDTLAPFKYVSVQGLAKKIRNSVLIIMAK